MEKLKAVSPLALAGGVVALALTQVSVLAVLAGLAVGMIGFALMPSDTVQR